MLEHKQNEQVLCVPRKELPYNWLGQNSAVQINENEFFDTITQADVQWLSRGQAEYDPAYKQLIPYIIMLNRDDKIGCYLRAGSESRLHNLWSLGIGGHLNLEDQPADKDLFTTILNGLNRELSEEIQDLPDTDCPQLIGVINEEQTEVGTVHLGLVFLLKLENIAEIIPGHELNQFSFIDLPDAKNLNLELWSELALKIIK